MSDRRDWLEQEISSVRKKIKELSDETPKEIVDAWEKELISLEFELNNLYDDDENDYL